MNQCEDLMDKVEHRFAAPQASPDEIANFIASLPSLTVSAGRTLHPALLARLKDIAGHHKGQVPLHGRLFAQWMHHAYPRECPYPHLSGTVRPQSPEEYVKQHKMLPVASEGDMRKIAASLQNHDKGVENSEEITAWHHQEELYVGQSHTALPSKAAGSVHGYLRPIVFLSAITAFVFTLVRRSSTLKKAALGTSSGKDLFV